MTRARDLADSADKDITGTLTVDAIDVQGTVTADAVAVAGASGAQITVTDNSPSNVALFMGAGNTSVSIGSTSSDPLTFLTANAERMRIDSSGNVGIGTSSPTDELHIAAAGASSTTDITIENTNASGQGCALRLKQANTLANSKIVFDDGGTESGFVFDGGANSVLHYVNGSEAMRIDSSGVDVTGTISADNIRVGVTLDSWGANSHVVQMGDAATDTGALAWNTVSGADYFDLMYQSYFDGTNYKYATAAAASRISQRNGSITFDRKAAGTADATFTWDNSLKIESSGNILVGKTAIGNSTGTEIRNNGRIQLQTPGDDMLRVNRTSDDGALIIFKQDGTTEGTISVSGTTVTYGGGHLARWSRLSDNSKDTNIVKGTVMTNLDQMVEWGDEDNEQLNCTAVSSTEGDANVAGVFVSWDESDEWNDYYVAMTGDMVIRIAQGTTVARGDLLMSAGDGTAKPQGDDIVRSKTIAKVTSTNVSHTYNDGSYLVPCVLMAC